MVEGIVLEEVDEAEGAEDVVEDATEDELVVGTAEDVVDTEEEVDDDTEELVLDMLEVAEVVLVGGG